MKLHRQMLDWEWFDNSHMVHIWIYFLLKANYQNSKWHGIDVPRGSFITSIDSISKATKLSAREVRTCLTRLKTTGEVTIKTTNRYSMITICNYDSYNICNDESDKQKDKPEDKQTTTEEEINNIIIESEDIDNTKKKKKEKNNKKEKDEKFEECWLAYNRKGSKAKSLEYWRKLSDEEKELVLPHIKVYVSSRERVYQKDFERYLRDKVFKTIIVKGNDTIYDPDKFDKNNEYHPTTEGFFQYWNEERQCLMFNGYIDQLNDGYTEDNRPDGATVAWQMYTWKWSSRKKKWIKQND